MREILDVKFQERHSHKKVPAQESGNIILRVGTVARSTTVLGVNLQAFLCALYMFLCLSRFPLGAHATLKLSRRVNMSVFVYVGLTKISLKVTLPPLTITHAFTAIWVRVRLRRPQSYVLQECEGHFTANVNKYGSEMWLIQKYFFYFLENAKIILSLGWFCEMS